MAEMNRFDKAAAARGVKKSEREKSWGQQATDRAQLAQGQTSRFGKANLPKERNLQPSAEQKPSIVINGRKYTDPKLIEAKQAVEQEKADRANEAQLRNRVSALSQSKASLQALLVGWLKSTPSFFPSNFNVTSLSNAVTKVVATDGREVSVELFNEVFEWLTANNYLEKIMRRRGEPAPQMFPEYKPEQERAR
ncbi:MAG: hypothetical protein ACRD4S_12710 [Candidatus Acidiferrales bacterium]